MSDTNRRLRDMGRVDIELMKGRLESQKATLEGMIDAIEKELERREEMSNAE